MAPGTSALSAPPMSTRRLTDYFDDGFAIKPRDPGPHPDAVGWTLARLDRLERKD